jgi:hypothetical protein
MFKKNLFKKSLVVGIIVLFIGTSVLPTISGSIVKTSNKSTIIGPTKLLLSDNYVNGYWKFDEGSGNIAYDSSLHNFDGTINGATWTTGYSGYALDFDGVNDDVDLNAYAQNNLGFNKTDDIMFEFYFQTTSTNEGIIYSMCHTYGYNPGIHIAMNPNGTLEFRAWRLSCGIVLDSTKAYNNGNWHYAKITYNGITANPTVEIYVDNSFDTNVTEWVCDFHSDQFNYAKIGRQANQSINFFNGIIDEFKITKYPGGNEQNPPDISGPGHGDPGEEYDFTFVTNDPEGDDIRIQIDWGDGQITDWLGPYQSGEPVTLSHKWNEEGKYYIKARSKDYWHFSRWSDPYELRIGNFPPDAPTINGPKYGEPGIQYTYTFKAIDHEENNVSYYVEWGDGKYTDWFGPYPSNTDVTASHAWTSKGNYNIRAKAKDNLSLESDWSDLYPVRIGDEPPAKPTITGPSSGKTGIEYNFTFVTTDPEGDNVYYEIKWGDGKEEVTDYYKSGKTVTRSHTWEKKGTYIIQARAGDIFDKKSQWESMIIVIIQKNKGAYRSFINQKFANILFFKILEQCYLRFIR